MGKGQKSLSPGRGRNKNGACPSLFPVGPGPGPAPLCWPRSRAWSFGGLPDCRLCAQKRERERRKSQRALNRGGRTLPRLYATRPAKMENARPPGTTRPYATRQGPSPSCVPDPGAPGLMRHGAASGRWSAEQALKCPRRDGRCRASGAARTAGSSPPYPGKRRRGPCRPARLDNASRTGPGAGSRQGTSRDAPCGNGERPPFRRDASLRGARRASSRGLSSRTQPRAGRADMPGPAVLAPGLGPRARRAKAAASASPRQRRAFGPCFSPSCSAKTPSGPRRPGCRSRI